VTSEGVTSDNQTATPTDANYVDEALGHEPVDADAAMYCYRHPDRETRVRCGRCDRPICTRCAMQGPVGFRCKQCGTLAYDPMTSLRPTQALLGLLVATGLAAVVGFIAWQIGLIGIIIGFFAGGVIAESVIRVIGYKRGPYIVAVVVVGIVAGILVGYGAGYWTMFLSNPEIVAEMTQAGISPLSMLTSDLGWAVVAIAAAVVGAYTRLR